MVSRDKDIFNQRLIAELERLEQDGRSMRELSIEITGKPDFIRDMLRRQHMPKSENLPRLAEVLGVSVDWLLGRSDKREPVLSEVSFADRRIEWRGPQPDLSPIPLVGTGDCATISLASETGEMLEIERCSFDADHTVRMLARPPALRGVPGLYAIYFRGESMMPRFEPGEVGIVDPTRPPRPGDYVLVQLTNGADDEVVSVLVKRLVRASSRELVLEQFNPPATFTVPRRRVARLHRILRETDLLLG